MTSTPVSSSQTMQYAPATLVRAVRAVRCAPFRLALFVTMRQESVELKAIAGEMGTEYGYTRKPVSELTTENELLWLIQVGLLRREVDGQGLTDSFRLTPLGHQLVERWRQQGNDLQPPTFSDRFYNALSRWVRLPVWLQWS